MAYIITRSKKTGYVQMVEKGRVNGDVRTKGYVCGLGTMTQEEFKHFQKWAHSITDQELRKRRVINCPLAVESSKEVEGKVAASKQKKTTVKRAPKQKKVVDTPETRRRKAEERETFRREYEERKGIKREQEIKTTKEPEGIAFKTIKGKTAQRKMIDERIKQLNYKIANAKSDIRGWEKGTASGWKIDNAHEAIRKYEDARKILNKQRTGLKGR